MSPLEIMEARLAELRKEYDVLNEQRGALIDLAAAERRSFTDIEQAAYDAAGTKRDALERDIPPVKARVEELREAAARDLAAAPVRQSERSPATVTDPEVYAKGNRRASYIRDLAQRELFGDRDAADRLQRHGRAMADTPEIRALGNTNTTGGSGGELAPPLWLVADYVKLARPGRVTLDLFTKSPVPTGVASVNIPRIVTGTTVALQSTQNTALTQTDMTTAYVSTGFTTLGGKQLVSQQLLDQSAIDLDQVITTDLAAAYAQTLATQVWSGAGTGANNNSVINGLVNATVQPGNITAYTGTASAATFYSKCNGMLASFVTSRYAPPTHWVMHPRRWFWLMAQTDSSGRPLVVPRDGGVQAYNAMGAEMQGVYDRGSVGMFLGLPVVIDPLLPTNFGAGTNQDRVYLAKFDDLWWFESPVVAEVFRETYSDSMGVLFRLYSYNGAILNRQPNALAYLDGAALTPPAF